jgi:predicted dehydrogenase
MPDVEVLALADADRAQLEAVGALHSITDLYTDFRGLVQRQDLDAVSISAPNFLHAPIAIAAFEAGKHVLCEKPLARTGREAETIVQAATKAGRVLKVMFNHRTRADIEALKIHIEDGGLGRIYHARAFWLRRSGIPGLGSWFTSKEMAGGGPLIDLGVHVLDMALYLLGESQVARVSAATYSELGPRGRGASRTYKIWGDTPFEVEDLATALLRFADGSSLSLETSWATYRRANDEFGVTLYGTEGGAEIKIVDYVQEDTLRIFMDVAGLPTELRPQLPRADGFGRIKVTRAFVEAVRGGDWAPHKGQDGLYRSRIIDACYLSSKEGREVGFTEVLP